ncbi:hypothetical protein LTR78_008880 [Recurvomyces mirabilis]|uniref:GCN5-related N-acetyltransferase Rv2170-like domain-containing protein n=1 Tax=Recurvomyces mirabilis TaxID=574656 RepID=A0AAE0WGS6_9PEZI|nr:hypothetical protein LTR78_008880 [Recurvomyces mirabilis]KAK5155795.1 hypothetical protein LTS14_005361 [Recurvomyces mirabilis]
MTPVDIIHAFPLTEQPGYQVILSCLDILRPHLPYSLPLYRRLQLGRFFESSVILSNLRKEDIRLNVLPPGQGERPGVDVKGNEGWRSQSGRDDALLKHWVIAFVDRSSRPETEAWMFGTWEAGSVTNQSGEEEEKIKALVEGVVRATARLPLPPSIHQQGPTTAFKQDSHGRDDKDSIGFTRTDYASHTTNKNITLWGAIHTQTAHLLQTLGVVPPEFKAGAVANHTFIFDVASMPTPPDLPKDLYWGTLSPTHFPLVRSRTPIPRQEKTMAVLPNLAIFPIQPSSPSKASPEHDPVPRPIAWAFIGLDGSLTTLHVEPSYRNRGLAKALTTKLFRENMSGFWEGGAEETKWALGYVAVGNEASSGMCRSLGGRSEWECYWVRVDLGALAL